VRLAAALGLVAASGGTGCIIAGRDPLGSWRSGKRHGRASAAGELQLANPVGRLEKLHAGSPSLARTQDGSNVAWSLVMRYDDRRMIERAPASRHLRGMCKRLANSLGGG
jgi:hypothetical protein